MDGKDFSGLVQSYLRASGHSQQHLADMLGLHPGVLNRKLHGSGNAYLTQVEIKRVIVTLAQWQAISERGEALRLLELARLKQSCFSAEEWNASPLCLLEIEPTEGPASGRGDGRAGAVPHNLPAPVTRLIGREQCVERLEHLLVQDTIREVTITGAGGSGKTRLALHVASELAPGFPDGAWLVSLEEVSEPERVVENITGTLEIAGENEAALQGVIACLQDKKMLLVLDGFEEVKDASSLVGRLLASAPALKVLITSRAALHLYGEVQFRLPPLDIPDIDGVSRVVDLEQYGSVQLFLERARAVVPAFALTDENKASVARICAAVDGLPLALELAAARVGVLSPALLLERMSRRLLDVLTGGASNLPWRQQTLRRTIESSYALLSPVERLCFLCLGVFSDGCYLKEAEEIIGEVVFEGKGGSERGCMCVPDILGKLVDSSLLIQESMRGGQVRFTMLKVMRAFALELVPTEGKLGRLDPGDRQGSPLHLMPCRG